MIYPESLEMEIWEEWAFYWVCWLTQMVPKPVRLKDQRWTWRLFMFAVRPQEINRIWTLHCGYGQLRMTTCFMVLKEYFLRKIFIADFPNLSPFPQACTTRCENISVNKKTRLVKLRSKVSQFVPAAHHPWLMGDAASHQVRKSSKYWITLRMC